MKRIWDKWEDLPPWLQACTYWAFLFGGPVDEKDSARFYTAMYGGASAREVVQREEPRWMVKTLLILSKAGCTPEKLSVTRACKAVALFFGIGESTVKGRYYGDPGKTKAVTEWTRPTEEVDSWGVWTKGNESLGEQTIIDRFKTRGRLIGQGGSGGLVRIPDSEWMVRKWANPRERRYGWTLRKFDLPKCEDLMSPELDLAVQVAFLALWQADEDLPRITAAALDWLVASTTSPNQAEKTTA